MSDWTLSENENVLEKLKTILHKRKSENNQIEESQETRLRSVERKRNTYEVGACIGRINGLYSENRNINILLQMIDGWEIA